jgi:hypothetical protein
VFPNDLWVVASTRKATAGVRFHLIGPCTTELDGFLLVALKDEREALRVAAHELVVPKLGEAFKRGPRKAKAAKETEDHRRRR